MKIQRNLGFLSRPLSHRQAKKQKLDQLAKEEYPYSRLKMTGLWAAGAGASGLAGLGVAKLWEVASLPGNFGPAGMLIGGSVGAAATYFALGDQLPTRQRLAVSLAAGAGSALAWNHFGLAGLKEGVGMAIGGGIGAYLGAKSVPEGQDSLLNRVAGATFGLGLCHVAGIVGATGGGLGAVGASLFPILGGAAGDIIARQNRRVKAREL